MGDWINGNYADTRTYVLPNGQIKRAKWTNNKKGEYDKLTADEETYYRRQKAEAEQKAAEVDREFQKL